MTQPKNPNILELSEKLIEMMVKEVKFIQLKAPKQKMSWLAFSPPLPNDSAMKRYVACKVFERVNTKVKWDEKMVASLALP